MLDNKTFIGYKGRKLISTLDNARHIFICGTTGSGKTVALSNYIESAIVKNYPLLIIDGKGDEGSGSILEMTKMLLQKYGSDKKFYLIGMNDFSNVSYNPFNNASPTIVKDMLINLTTWSEEHYKANAERYIQHLLFYMKLLDIPLNFTNILKNFSTDSLMILSKEAVNKGLTTKDEHLHTLTIIKACGEIAANAAARFMNLAESDIGKKIFGESNIDIFQAIEEKAIIPFLLNPLIYPELTPLLGRLILTDCKKCVSKLYSRHDIGRTFFIFDEINTYASPILVDLLNKSRSASVTCIPATQSLSDLDYSAGEAFKEQIIENCNNYIVLRQNSAKNAEAWAMIFGTEEALNITYQIGGSNGYSNMNATGMGSARKERRFFYHPDDIKTLKTGEAVFMSKDTGEHSLIKVRKGI